MEIHENIEIVDLGLYLSKSETLVIADLQLGYEAALVSAGYFVPKFNFEQIMEKLKSIFLNLKMSGKNVSTVVINGDLKQEFGKISKQEWQEVLDIFRFLKKSVKNIVVIRGNHDVFLGPIAKTENVEILKEGYFIEGEKVYITHGHKIFESSEFEKAEIVIVGHDHPSVTLVEGVKSEKYKCFLKGKYEDKVLIVLPSFNFVSTGTNIANNDFLSPFLQQDILGFEVWVLEDKPYYFGKVKNLPV